MKENYIVFDQIVEVGSVEDITVMKHGTPAVLCSAHHLLAIPEVMEGKRNASALQG